MSGSSKAGVAAALVATAVVCLLLGAGVVYVTISAMAGPAGGGPGGGPGGGGPGGPGGGMMGGPPPASIRVGEARLEDLQPRLDVVGRLEAVRRATVAAEVAGRVVEMPVEVGDAVKAGETVLAKIDPVWTRLEVERAKADVASAEATYEQAQRDATYLEDLLARASANEKEVEDARTKVKEDEAALATATVMLERAQTQEGRLEVVPPFDAQVAAKRTEVGEYVTPGAAVVDLVSTGEVDAVVDVPEAVVGSLRPGDEVEVRIEPLNQTVTGKVAAIRPTGNDAARTYPVKIRLDDAAGRLRVGMSVTARVPTGERRPQLTVPKDAVLQRDSGAVVWAVMGGGGEPRGEGLGGDTATKVAAPGGGPPTGPPETAVPVGVAVLFGEGDRWVVRALPSAGDRALEAGMRVVVLGAERLFPGQPVMIDPRPMLGADADAER